VVLDGDRWKVEVEGGGAEGSYDGQEQAIGEAREIARRNQSELLVHGRDGRIRQRDSHGNDPRDEPG
jgi:hypothetical protein